MRVTEGMLIRGMMKDIEGHLSEIARVQQQIATGKRIHQPSEDPAGTSKALGLNFTMKNLEQYKKNVDEAVAWMNITLTNLGEVREIINEAKTKAIQGANDTIGAEERAGLAEVVDRLRGQLLDVSNSKWGDSYVFAGHKTARPPFNGSFEYQGDEGILRRLIGPGESVVMNVNGDEIFKGDVDFFQVLTDLKTALENNDVNAINQTLTPLENALNHILRIEATMGADMQRVESAKDRIETAQATIFELQAKNEDVDLAEAVVQLQGLQNTYQAALATSSQILQQTLLRFLR